MYSIRLTTPDKQKIEFLQKCARDSEIATEITKPENDKKPLSQGQIESIDVILANNYDNMAALEIITGNTAYEIIMQHATNLTATQQQTITKVIAANLLTFSTDQLKNLALKYPILFNVACVQKMISETEYTEFIYAANKVWVDLEEQNDMWSTVAAVLNEVWKSDADDDKKMKITLLYIEMFDQ